MPLTDVVLSQQQVCFSRLPQERNTDQQVREPEEVCSHCLKEEQVPPPFNVKQKEGTTSMEYLVSASFHPQDQAEILAHIQEEEVRLQTLREQGTVKEVYLSADRLRVWLVMQGTSQDHVQKDLESLPLYPYMEIAITKVNRR
jgi:muconolactone delta-isomerase